MLLEALKPTTKLRASVLLIATVIIIIAYFVWIDYFIAMSIYVALLAPLALFLLFVFNIMFDSICKLFATSTKKQNKTATSSPRTSAIAGL